MAHIDPQHRCIVLRAVYDGPALAGKTTNLKSLASSLGTDIFSAEEAEGRTLYFDWVDYVGGMFEGLPIRCQIVSVPGQQVLEARRRMLLETADVVVFVADSRPQQLQENGHSFALLRQVMSRREPAPAIVVQANKRDVEGAVSLDTLGDALRQACGDGGLPLALTQASADQGLGVRETFVLAVRLALDRTRALRARQALPELSPEVDDGPQLLAAIQSAELEASPSLDLGPHPGTERRLGATLGAAKSTSGGATVGGATAEEPSAVAGRDEPPPSSQSGPAFPDTSVPMGFVWPPVEGRVIVHESARSRTQLERSPGGDWVGYSDSWKFRAPLEGLFFELEPARQALLGWVHWHVAVGRHMSQNRSLVLAPESDGVWRLWQIVRRQPSLQDKAKELFSQPDDVELGRGLFRLIDLRLRAQKSLVAGGWLGRLDLASIGVSEAGVPVFIGFSPYPAKTSSIPGAPIDEPLLLRTEIAPFLRSELKLAPRRLPTVLASLQEAAAVGHRSDIAATLQQILLGH